MLPAPNRRPSLNAPRTYVDPLSEIRLDPEAAVALSSARSRTKARDPAWLAGFICELKTLRSPETVEVQRPSETDPTTWSVPVARLTCTDSRSGVIAVPR